MKIWLDVMNSLHAHIINIIIKHFEQDHEIILTEDRFERQYGFSGLKWKSLFIVVLIAAIYIMALPESNVATDAMSIFFWPSLVNAATSVHSWFQAESSSES